MTQRKIERIAGWVALSSWIVFFGIVGAMAYATTTIPTPAKPSAAITSASKSRARRHGLKPPAVPSTEETFIKVLAYPTALIFLASCSVTSWWTWRRKQRILAEIRAEAWGRENLESRRRAIAAR